jgi:beta-hydroxylase
VIGKRLKAWDKRVYYLVKWAIFGGLALWIFW